jgi:hypothetical protein
MVEHPDLIRHHRYAFVAGLHRSGTTLVARCLAEHPDVSGFHDTGVPEDEGQFLQTVYPVAGAHGGPGRFAFDPKAHLTEHSPLATPQNAERLRSEWSRHWDASRAVLLEKSPPNLIRTRFLQAMFPGASFAVVIRHPVAVAFAVKTRRPRHTDLGEMLRHWVVAHELLEADLPHLLRVRAVAYESFVRAPGSGLAALQEFLGLSSTSSSLEIRTDTNDRYFSMWRDLLGRTVRGRKYRALVTELEARVRRFGYSLENPAATGDRPGLAAVGGAG